MSLLGFDKLLSRLESVEKEFLVSGIRLAQYEFKKNFDTESDSETDTHWHPVKRKTPPTILVKTGEMKSQAVRTGRVVYSRGSAVLTIDPIDRDGRGYAAYHQDGDGVSERPFVTQSADLTNKQEQALLNILDKFFQ